MAFTLSRGGPNVIAEVQRWQYFLRRIGIEQVGRIDGAFGENTERATKMFQADAGVGPTGKVNQQTLEKARGQGYTIVPPDYYSSRSGADWPPRPANLTSPGQGFRNANLGCFKFIQRPVGQRSDPDEIVIRGSCDGNVPNWEAENMVTIQIPQMRFTTGYNGRFKCHRKVADPATRLFAAWERADLLHLLIHFSGAFNARYIRDKSPGTGGHGEKTSNQASSISNHATGSAFDVNHSDNGYGAVPALCGRRGSVRELVEIANTNGFFWGGHYNNKKDGMHFELARMD